MRRGWVDVGGVGEERRGEWRAGRVTQDWARSQEECRRGVRTLCEARGSMDRIREYFKLDERGSSFSQEARGGVATFLVRALAHAG